MTNVGLWLFGIPPIVVNGKIVSSTATLINHLGVDTISSRRRIGSTGRSLCGLKILDQAAINDQCASVSIQPPNIYNMRKCKTCIGIARTWLTDDWSNLLKS